MSISELILELQQLKKRHGDIPVMVLEDQDGALKPVDAYLVMGEDENERVSEVTFVDRETALAFME